MHANLHRMYATGRRRGLQQRKPLQLIFEASPAIAESLLSYTRLYQMLGKPATPMQWKSSKRQPTLCRHTLNISTLSNAIYPLLFLFPATYNIIPTAPTTTAAKPASGAYLAAAPFVALGAGLDAEDVPAVATVLDAAALLVDAAPAPALTSFGFRLPHWALHCVEPGVCVLHCWKVNWHS